MFEPLINEWRGRLFKTMGDCYFAEFHSVVDAVNCSVQLQQKLQTYNEKETEDRQIWFRRRSIFVTSSLIERTSRAMGSMLPRGCRSASGQAV